MSFVDFLGSRSGKSKRKGEKRKWTLKEGSAYEDCALIEALSNVVRATSACAEEVRNLLRALVMYAFDSEAVTLQRKYDDVTTLMREHREEIWSTVQQQTNTVSFKRNISSFRYF